MHSIKVLEWMYFALVSCNFLFSALLKAPLYVRGSETKSLRLFVVFSPRTKQGNTPLGLPALQALVEASGGYALPHSSLNSPQFTFNLRHCLSQTHMTSFSVPDSTLKINGCVVDLKMSDFINPTRIIGPAVGVDDDAAYILPSEQALFVSCADMASSCGISTENLPDPDVIQRTLSRIVVGRFDPLASLSVMLEVTDKIEREQSKHAFFQIIARWVENDGKTIVTRVYSHRMQVARTIHDFLDGLDEDVIPVFLAREAVLRAIVQEGAEDTWDESEELAVEARRALDATVHRISRAYRLLSQERGGSR